VDEPPHIGEQCFAHMVTGGKISKTDSEKVQFLQL